MNYSIEKIFEILFSTVNFEQQKNLVQIKNYITKLEEQKKENETKNFMLQEKIEELINEVKDYDDIFGFNEEMSIKEKKKLNDKMNKEEIRIIKFSEKSIQDEYAKDMLNIDDMVDLSIQQQSLQYEIHELFDTIKNNVQEDKMNKFKQAKIDFYKCIDIFNNIVHEEFKENVFTCLEDIFEYMKSVYIIDKKLKDLS